MKRTSAEKLLKDYLEYMLNVAKVNRDVFDAVEADVKNAIDDIARMRRCAEKWANEQNVSERTVYYGPVMKTESHVRVCACCGHEWNNSKHAHGCDAAHVLELEREKNK